MWTAENMPENLCTNWWIPYTYFLGKESHLVFINCDDEEDCVQGSGSGDGTPGSEFNSNTGFGSSQRNKGSNSGGGTSGGGKKSSSGSDEEVFIPGGTDSKFQNVVFTVP